MGCWWRGLFPRLRDSGVDSAWRPPNTAVDVAGGEGAIVLVGGEAGAYTSVGQHPSASAMVELAGIVPGAIDASRDDTGNEAARAG